MRLVGLYLYVIGILDSQVPFREVSNIMLIWCVFRFCPFLSAVWGEGVVDPCECVCECVCVCAMWTLSQSVFVWVWDCQSLRSVASVRLTEAVCALVSVVFGGGFQWIIADILQMSVVELSASCLLKLVVVFVTIGVYAQFVKNRGCKKGGKLRSAGQKTASRDK